MHTHIFVHGIEACTFAILLQMFEFPARQAQPTFMVDCMLHSKLYVTVNLEPQSSIIILIDFCFPQENCKQFFRRFRCRQKNPVASTKSVHELKIFEKRKTMIFSLLSNTLITHKNDK